MIDQIARAQSAPALMVAWARMHQDVADRSAFTEAVLRVGSVGHHRVARLVRRFYAEGLGVLVPRAKGHPPLQYSPTEAERILPEVPPHAGHGT